MLHVLNVVHTSFACALMNTTRAWSPLSQAAARWPHFAAAAELFWQNVLRQATAWLLKNCTLCPSEDGARHFFPSVLRRAVVHSWIASQQKRLQVKIPKTTFFFWCIFCLFAWLLSFRCFFFPQIKCQLIPANNLNPIASRYINLGSIKNAASWPSWCAQTNSN